MIQEATFTHQRVFMYAPLFSGKAVLLKVIESSDLLKKEPQVSFASTCRCVNCYIRLVIFAALITQCNPVGI